MDSSDAFVVQTNVAGGNGYGKFTMDASGAWTYTMNSAHNEFVGGTTYTDSFTVATADGTEQVVTVTIPGTNDAAVITGASTASLTETNAALTHRRHAGCNRRGQLGRLRGADERGGRQRLRQFSIDAGGAWTYTMNSAHDEFVGGTTTPTASRWRRPTARRRW